MTTTKYSVLGRTFTDADEMLAFAVREIRAEGAGRTAYIFDADEGEYGDDIGVARSYLKGDGTLGSSARLYGERNGLGGRRVEA